MQSYCCEYINYLCAVTVELVVVMLRLVFILSVLHHCRALVATSDLLEKYLNADYVADSILLNKKCLSANNGKGSDSDNCKHVDYFLKLRKAQEDINREIQISTKGAKQFLVETLPDHLAYSNVFEDYIVAKRYSSSVH